MYRLIRSLAKRLLIESGLTSRKPNRIIIKDYFRNNKPYALEIGSNNPRQGWLVCDLAPSNGIVRLDATRKFHLRSESFDFIYAEHMIEHISFQGGENMLKECFRLLQSKGRIRIVTPSIEFLLHILTQSGTLERSYKEWSVRSHVGDAPAVTDAFFLNNFMRNWGHQFIYDKATLTLLLKRAGFTQIVELELGISDEPFLCGLENKARLPEGFLELESMVFEASKP